MVLGMSEMRTVLLELSSLRGNLPGEAAAKRLLPIFLWGMGNGQRRWCLMGWGALSSVPAAFPGLGMGAMRWRSLRSSWRSRVTPKMIKRHAVLDPLVILLLSIHSCNSWLSIPQALSFGRAGGEATPGKPPPCSQPSWL